MKSPDDDLINRVRLGAGFAFAFRLGAGFAFRLGAGFAFRLGAGFAFRLGAGFAFRLGAGFAFRLGAGFAFRLGAGFLTNFLSSAIFRRSWMAFQRASSLDIPNIQWCI
jgi:hypothetical protein